MSISAKPRPLLRTTHPSRLDSGGGEVHQPVADDAGQVHQLAGGPEPAGPRALPRVQADAPPQGLVRRQRAHLPGGERGALGAVLLRDAQHHQVRPARHQGALSLSNKSNVEPLRPLVPPY
eukprot:8988028-Pyramimonas_sp.AAC.1